MSKSQWSRKHPISFFLSKIVQLSQQHWSSVQTLVFPPINSVIYDTVQRREKNTSESCTVIITNTNFILSLLLSGSDTFFLKISYESHMNNEEHSSVFYQISLNTKANPVNNHFKSSQTAVLNIFIFEIHHGSKPKNRFIPLKQPRIVTEQSIRRRRRRSELASTKFLKSEENRSEIREKGRNTFVFYSFRSKLFPSSCLKTELDNGLCMNKKR